MELLGIENTVADLEELRTLPVGGHKDFPLDRRNSIGTMISSYLHKKTDMRFKTSSKGFKGFFRVWRLEDVKENAA